MALKTLVKVGSLTNLSDARYCAGMDVQLLGFQALNTRPSHITPSRFQEIRGWITGPGIVAELYGLTDQQELDSVCESFRPDYLEVGIAELAVIQHCPLPLIIRLRPGEVLPKLQCAVAYVIGDADIVLPLAIPLIAPVRSVQEVDAALNRGVAGVALEGGMELRPGLKTYDDLAPILEMLEAE